MSGITPELLMRYADGEVSMLERQNIEKRRCWDQDVDHLAATFRDQRIRLQAALTEQDEAAGLRRCEMAIDRGLAERRRRLKRADILRWALPIAAALLITMMGSIMSLRLADQRVEAGMAKILAHQAEDRELIMQTTIEALERMASGRTLTWMNQDSGTQGSITPLGTFRATNGQWCREYREMTTFSTTEERRLSIACREKNGSWSPVLESFGGVGTSSGSSEKTGNAFGSLAGRPRNSASLLAEG